MMKRYKVAFQRSDGRTMTTIVRAKSPRHACTVAGRPALSECPMVAYRVRRYRVHGVREHNVSAFALVMHVG